MKVFPSSWGYVYLGKTGDGLQAAIEQLNPSKVVIIADHHTAEACVPLLAGITDTTHCIVIPAGEQHKNLESCRHIWTSLIEAGADRASLVLNTGGGMICDLGGFAAACYQRGIRFAHIPTSVLAMADAAIGAKTGIDFSGYKNYLGRIEPPAFTWIDPVFIRTLPAHEITNGMAEVIKHAITGSRALWQLLSTVQGREEIEWLDLLEKNIPVKLEVIEADPLEHNGRKKLNFGHTIGHALESHFLQQDDPVSHGQAVALGMLAESRIAADKGMLSEKDFQAIYNLVVRWLSPFRLTLPGFDALTPWIGADKKKSGGQTGYSLPDAIGSCRWDVRVEENEAFAGYAWLQAQAKAAQDRLSVQK